MTKDEQWMKIALRQAAAAADAGEVPVGAVIVRNGSLVSVGRNEREARRSALCHAEISAIAQACQVCGGWRLEDCELYVTLEPCPMCAGAAVSARLKRVVYGTADPKTGSCHSVVNLFSLPYPYRPECVGGVLEEECTALLSDFFRQQRRQRQTQTKTGVILHENAVFHHKRPYPLMAQALAALQAHYPLYLIGSGTREALRQQLLTDNLQHYFSDIEANGHTGRSQAENIRLLMKRSRLTRAVFVGADDADRAAAQTAGLPFLAAVYANGHPKNCQAKAETAEQLPAVILSLLTNTKK